MNLKEQRKAFWAGKTPIQAFDALMTACQHIDDQALPLNRETLREHSGVTYTNALAAGIAVYKQRKQLTDTFSNTEATLLHILAKYVDDFFKHEKQKFEKAFETEKQSFVNALDEGIAAFGEMQDELQEKQSQIDQLQAQLSELHEAFDQTCQQLEERQTDLSNMEARYRNVIEDKQALESTCAELRHQLADNKAEYQKNLSLLQNEQKQMLEQLNHQHEAETERLMKRWTEERAQWQVEQEKSDLNNARLTDKVSGLEKKLHEQEIVVKTLTIEKTELQKLEPLVEDNQQLKNDLKEAQRQQDSLKQKLAETERENLRLLEKLNEQSDLKTMMAAMEQRIDALSQSTSKKSIKENSDKSPA